MGSELVPFVARDDFVISRAMVLAVALYLLFGGVTGCCGGYS